MPLREQRPFADILAYGYNDLVEQTQRLLNYGLVTSCKGIERSGEKCYLHFDTIVLKLSPFREPDARL